MSGGAARLRERVERRLSGTRPGGDPLQTWLGGLSPGQSEALRRHLPKVLRRAAVLVPLVERPQGLAVLLTQRASHLKHHAGQISFPGGRIEAQDAGPWEAALRETEEEIGLPREHVTFAGYLVDQVVMTGYLVTPAVGFVRPGFPLQLDPTEVDDVFEVPLDFLLDPAHHVPRERSLAGVSFRTYEFPYEGRNIWGATAGMLFTLCRMLEEEPGDVD